MTKFLNKAGMIHFLEKIKEMNHGMRLMPSITVKFGSIKVTSDEPENIGSFVQDGLYIDQKIFFRINAPQEWIEEAMNDNNYKILLFHPSSRNRKWTYIDDSREEINLPTDGRVNYLIHAISLSECRAVDDYYFEFPYTIRHILMRFIGFPNDSTNKCMRDILFNGTQGEFFRRKGSRMYILGEENATACWGKANFKITNGFSAIYRLGLTYMTPFEENYIAPVNPSEFKACFGLGRDLEAINKLFCRGKITNYRMSF